MREQKKQTYLQEIKKLHYCWLNIEFYLEQKLTNKIKKFHKLFFYNIINVQIHHSDFADKKIKE